MCKKLISVILGTLLAISLTGCGDSFNNVRSNNLSTINHSLNEPLSDLLYGMTKIDRFVANGDYAKAKTLSRNLSDEFHDAVLPLLTERKGKAYAHRIDAKYDELENAVESKNKSKINQLTMENRENLKTIAPILGVSLISF